MFSTGRRAAARCKGLQYTWPVAIEVRTRPAVVQKRSKGLRLQNTAYAIHSCCPQNWISDARHPPLQIVLDVALGRDSGAVAARLRKR